MVHRSIRAASLYVSRADDASNIKLGDFSKARFIKTALIVDYPDPQTVRHDAPETLNSRYESSFTAASTLSLLHLACQRLRTL